MVCSMLSGKNIPNSFWPEVVDWTIYVLNRSPTLVVKDVTPQESWSGMKPSVAHFRVFGCVAHMHVLEARRTKLDNRSISCVLLGISEESKGYKLFDPIAKRIIVKIDDAKIDDVEIDACENERNDIAKINAGQKTDVGEEFQRRRRNFSEGEDRVRVSRNRKLPTWMGYYVLGEGLSENETHMALMVSNDPTCFEEVVKDLNWRWAMDEEIQSIKKNQETHYTTY
ncbi:uncharacterized protein LOC124829844 [Vigna umbellata]|uniref:uncharacterized protein LOC124829844 n=1 Tax=Vigna umbellata TaxID=87088 RepID=UPI001F5FCCDB|nr:uncharacterized protein LOC124829844 [Vigna umbellata]